MCVVNVGEPADPPPARRTGPDSVSAEPPIGHAHSTTINNHTKPSCTISPLSPSATPAFRVGPHSGPPTPADRHRHPKTCRRAAETAPKSIATQAFPRRPDVRPNWSINFRRVAGERYLRDTHITLSHLARELGYAEQSALTHSCRRSFGRAPTDYRRSMRSSGR